MLLRVLMSVFLTVMLMSCEKEIRNIANQPVSPVEPELTSEVIPVNINEQGFDFLEKVQGHWVGSNRIIADDWDWFAFDFRAIGPSMVHSMFEGGSMGNLFSSFYVADYKDTRTIMVRNGGVLNGIYRTSYFVLDSVNYSAEGDFYRFVDAIGGTDVMWMELRFLDNQLFFNAYTSRIGMFEPTRHMTFVGEKNNLSLATEAAIANNFPQNEVAWDFSQGFDTAMLYRNSEDEIAKSATFMWQDNNADIVTLAINSGDPWRIDQYPTIANLEISINRSEVQEDKVLFVYLSKEPLTDDFGFLSLDENAWNSILQFPVLTQGESQTEITYLHPGTYYITVVADMDGDYSIGEGDFTHVKKQITIDPSGMHTVLIDGLTVQN